MVLVMSPAEAEFGLGMGPGRASPGSMTFLCGWTPDGASLSDGELNSVLRCTWPWTHHLPAFWSRCLVLFALSV